MFWKRLVWTTAMLGVALLGIGGLAGCQAAETFPSRAITIICHTAAGSPSDLYVRTVASNADKLLKTTMSVENRTGGNGIVSYTQLKSQPADGYTAAAYTQSLAFALVAGTSALKLEDFRAVIIQAGQPAAIWVRTESDMKTIDDFVKYAKANPGKLKVGGTGTGSLQDLAMRLFRKKAGIDTAWVSFEGGNEAIVALLGGHVDATIMTSPNAKPHMDAGKVRPLVVASSQRVDYLPGTPTFKESGYDVVSERQHGVVVRKETPDSVVKTLHDAFKQVSTTQQWKDWAKTNVESDLYYSSEDATKLINKDAQEAIPLLKEAGIIK